MQWEYIRCNFGPQFLHCRSQLVRVVKRQTVFSSRCIRPFHRLDFVSHERIYFVERQQRIKKDGDRPPITTSPRSHA